MWRIVVGLETMYLNYCRTGSDTVLVGDTPVSEGAKNVSELWV